VRTIVIGDVHGCVDELSALLRACERASGDQVVLVGDLVAKGPDSRGVLALVRELGARSVLGNHDAHLLRVHSLQEHGAPATRPLKPETVALAASFSAEDWSQLAALPLWIELDEYDVLVVHGGIVPGIPLAKQDPDLLLNLRTIKKDGSGSRRPEDGVLWGSVYRGPRQVLFGHHATAGLQQHPFALGLDTGCVYGRELTACILPERRLVSVPARRAYAPIGGNA
jgi:hypothetical protein